MGLLSNPNFNPMNPSGDQGGTDLFVNDKDGNKFRVVDGDTVERIFDGETVDGKPKTQSYRLSDLRAQERHRVKDGEYYQGETSGNYDKRALYEVLNREGFSLNDLGEQQEGQGAGRRRLASLTTEAGEDVGEKLFSLGLFEETKGVTEDQLLAKKAGMLDRELFGSDGYEDLREDKPIANKGFKTRALSEGRWYNPDYHFGVDFDKKDRNKHGVSTNPLSTAWDVGMDGAVGDFGGFLESLGTVSPFYSDYLKEKGQNIQARAGFSAADSATQRVGSWSNLMAESDGAFDYLKNGLEYIGVNTVQSAPYLAGVAAAAVAAPLTASAVGAVGAGALVAGAAGSLAATVPLAALHAGNVWNQIDRFEYDKEGNLLRNETGGLINNRDGTAAGKAMTAGVIMASLDRLGLKGAMSVSDVLTAGGRKRAIALLRDKSFKETGVKLTTKQATKKFNQTAHKATVDLVEHMGRKTVEDRLLRKGLINFIGGAIPKIAQGAGSESLTEASQELIGFLTSSQVNEEITSIDQLVDHLQDNWTHGDNLKEILIESAIAGGAVGGGINVGANFLAAAKNRKFAVDYIYDPDPRSRRETANIFIKHEAKDGTIADQRAKTKRDRLVDKKGSDGFFDQAAEGGKDRPYWKQALFKKARGTTAITPIDSHVDADLFNDDVNKQIPEYTPEQLAINPASALGLVTHYAGRLVNAPAFNHLNNKVLDMSKSARSITSRLSKAKDSGSAGRTAEQQIDWVSSNLNGLSGTKWFRDNFGMLNSVKSRASLTNIMRDYGKYIHPIVREKGLNGVTDADIANINKSLEARTGRTITRADLPKLLEGSQRFEVYQQEVFDVQQEAINNEYGIDSKEATDFAKTFDKDWWWSHREPDKVKVARNKGKFIKFINTLKTEALAKNKDLTDAEKKQLKDPEYAEKAFGSILRGKAVDDFSLVSGVKWGKNTNRRVLDWGKKDVIIDGEKVSMTDFELDDIFTTMEKNNRKVSQRTTIMEYFGDGGADLDVLFSDMRKELIEGGMTPEEANQVVQNSAKDVKDIVDSITGNYNRIKNPTAEKVQNFLLQWSTISGLLLAGLSSIPEFGTIAIDIVGTKEARQAINHTLKESVSSIANNFRSKKLKDMISVATLREYSQNEQAAVDSAYEKVLVRTGLSTDQAGLYKKLGLDEENAGAGALKFAHDTVFKVNFLEAVTNLQRRINSAQAVDFIRTRAMALASIPEGQTPNGIQTDMIHQLRQLGIHVPTLVKDTKAIIDGDSKSSFDDIYKLDDDAYNADYNSLNQQVEVGIKNFVDFRVQNPGAANRPLWTQDPHWRLFTQFNGFISTVTTTLVPKLWNDKFMAGVKTKNPTLTYNAFGMIVLMVALGGMSQWLKDLLKYGESSPYLESDDLAYRALLSSGIMGQYEKAAQIVKPLYAQVGESVPQRVAETIAGPVGRQAGNLYDAGKYLGQDRPDAAVRSFLKNVPLFSSFPGWRASVSDFNNENN